MLAMASILTANDYEASVIEERTGRSIQDLAAGLQAVVVTRGGEGASLYVGETRTDIPVAPVAQVVDPTGCGDAHRAGLLYGLANGWSLHDACCLANVMGGFKIASRGPQNHCPSRADIAAVLQTHYGIEARLPA